MSSYQSSRGNGYSNGYSNGSSGGPPPPPPGPSSSSGGGGAPPHSHSNGSSNYGPVTGSSSGYSSSSYRHAPYSNGGGSSSGYHGSSSSSSSSSRSTGHLRSSNYSSSGGGGYRGGSSGYSSYSNGGSSGYSRGSGGGGGYSSQSYSNGRSYGGGGGGGGRRGKNEFGISHGQPGASLAAVDWTKVTLEPFQKKFYSESPIVSSMPLAEINAWRSTHTILCVGQTIPRPIFTFEQAGWPPYIMDAIKRQGFEKPTPIQSQGWPMAMSGRNVIGIAKTGSGKTLAFLLPSILHINAQPLLQRGDGPIVLVVAPTRELAKQIEEEASLFARSSKIKHCCVYGGASRRDQARRLQDGVEIVICAPGRLLDFLESGTTNLRRVTYLVLDEADRMLDMGFEPQLKSILSQVRPDRQILMWSATWPKEVVGLAEEFMGGSETIQVSVGNWDVSANKDVTQRIEIISNFEKTTRLYKLLRDQWSDDPMTADGGKKRKNPKVLVFVATKRSCNQISRDLRRDRWPVTCIHGDKQQSERDQALADFKSGRCPIMLATDVASRGIHVDDISLVINYDFPGNIPDYVHRIGRTGRAGTKGLAISFFTKDDSKRASGLIKILDEAKQEIPQGLVSMAKSASYGGGSRYGGNRYRGQRY